MAFQIGNLCCIFGRGIYSECTFNGRAATKAIDIPDNYDNCDKCNYTAFVTLVL